MNKVLILVFIFIVSYLPLFAQKKYEVAYKKAVENFNKGNSKKGFAYLEEALKLNPEYYDALYARSFYNFQQENYQQAIPDYNAILSKHPEDTTIYRYRGLANLYTKNFESAETDLLKALSLDSTDHTIYSDLGYFYYQVLDYERAKNYFNQSIAIKPSRFAYYQRAQTHYSEGEYEQALAALEKNLQADAKDAEALRLKALILMNSRRFAEAIKIYEQLMANADIEEPDDLFNWGLTYYQQKKYTQALVYFTTPKKHQDAQLNYYTALTHYKLKNNKAALQSINKVSDLTDMPEEENAPFFYNRAIIRWASKDMNGAVDDYLQSVVLLPEIVNQQNQYGDTLDLLANAATLLKGKYSKRQMDSVSAYGLTRRANFLFEEDGIENEALILINQAIALDSTNSESRFTRAKVFYFQEEYIKALQDVNKAIQYSAGKVNDEYFHLRGVIFSEMDLNEKAHQDFTKAITTNPNKAVYYYDRAFAWADLSDFQEAIADINRAIELDSTERYAYVLARAGFYNEIKAFDKALTDCEELVTNGPDRAVVYYQRGVALLGLKKYDEAVKDFTRAIRLEPDFPEASEKLREALREQ